MKGFQAGCRPWGLRSPICSVFPAERMLAYGAGLASFAGMIDGIRFKVCGLTSLIDAELADKVGADCLGFIFHPESPRRVTLAQYAAMAPRLPARRKVAVFVEPTPAVVAEAVALKFDFFQVHFRHDRPLSEVVAWSKTVGVDRLWLAPQASAGGRRGPAVAAVRSLFPDRYLSRRLWRFGQGRRLGQVCPAAGRSTQTCLDPRRGAQSREYRGCANPQRRQVC